MRILELEISQIRGITFLKLEPKGNNFLISGPNGTGKSSVIDAIDFLLTGDIRRLAGTGTKGVTVNKYGSHLDNNNLEESFVSAIVTVDGSQNFSIKRTINTPDQLEISDEKYRDHLDNVVSLAKEGQHILTRREILRYIATEPSKRAQRIQALLSLSRVEEIRQQLVKVQNHFKNQFKSSEHLLSNEKAEVATLVQSPDFDDDSLLQFINNQREILGSDLITTLDAQHIRSGIQYDDERRTQIAGTTSLQTDIDNVKNFETNHSNELQTIDTEIRQILHSLTDTTLANAFEQYELTQLGLGLLDDTGVCPLCETQWEPTELRAKLENKLQSAQAARANVERLTNQTKRIETLFNFLLSSLKRIIALSDQTGFADTNILRDWQQTLDTFKQDIQTPRKSYMSHISNDVYSGFITTQIRNALEVLAEDIKQRTEQLSPEQLAYDNLIKLEQSVQSWHKVQKEYQIAKKSYDVAQTLLKNFIESRDGVLNNLYDQIRKRFEEIYSQLHFEDESVFSAELVPSDTGLSLEVDFYGRGMHSPLALHSEGHQDSMGLCLFLALAEKIAKDRMNIIILDDVVMSVDAEHRKQLCKVLGELFKDFQIIIATHDKTWHHQLKAEGIINRKGTVEFLGWHIASGPRLGNTVDVWEKITEDLDKNDVPSAAHKLRRWGEMYFAEVCERLGAQVIFRQDAKWDLGNLFHPAIHVWKKHIKKAKVAANSWNKSDNVTNLAELDNKFKVVLEKTQAEQWVINPSVHYTAWLNLDKSEFNDVANSFRDLATFFECSDCGAMLRIDNPINPTILRCSCSNINWNLEDKPKS